MRFGRRGRRSSASRPEKPAETRGLEGTYDIVIVEDIEHYIPVNDGVHEPRSTCACHPLIARYGGFGAVGWMHRSIPSPL